VITSDLGSESLSRLIQVRFPADQHASPRSGDISANGGDFVDYSDLRPMRVPRGERLHDVR